jgi:hypothetical protein
LIKKYVAVSREVHSGRKWQRVSGYEFASTDIVCKLAIHEMPKAMLAFPLGFVRSTFGYSLAAILGLKDGVNLFVDSKVNWNASYIPAIYRAYPFAILCDENKSKVLCFDECSVQSNDSKELEDFFEPGGAPSKSMGEVLHFLRQVEANNLATQKVCSLLDELKLLEEWPILATIGNEDVKLDGIYRANESKLNSLDDQSFLMLKEAGALPAIYCQLLSMQHIEKLQSLARKAQMTAQQQLPAEFNLEILSRSGNISFSNV